MIAMAVVYRDRLYYHLFPRETTQTVGTSNESDVIIPELAVSFSVSCKNNEVILELSDGKILRAGLGEFVVADNDSRLSCYFTEHDRCSYSMFIPKNYKILVGRRIKVSDAGVKNDIVIKIPFISAEHFRIVSKDGTVTVVDNQSKNGLYLNGKKISEAVLKKDDVLSIYTVRITYRNNKLFFENVGSSLKVNKVSSLYY